MKKILLSLVALSFIVVFSNTTVFASGYIQSVSVGSQQGNANEGTAGSVTYTVSLTNTSSIAGNHTYTLSLTGTSLPTGATYIFESGDITVSGGNSITITSSTNGYITLRIYNTLATPQGTTSGITVFCDQSTNFYDRTSNSFSYIVDAPLPVELTSFTGSASNNVVNLKWATATEVNNYGFDVEKKVSNSESWEKIGFVAGNGNSNSPKNYSFADRNLTGGSTFTYRLKQMDNDGTFEYSDAVEVALVPDKIELYQNYPNPFNPTTNIRFSLPEAGRVVINIYNMLGEKVMELANREFEAGYQEVHVDASGLASGMYVYSIETNNFKAVKKMVLLR